MNFAIILLNCVKKNIFSKMSTSESAPGSSSQGVEVKLTKKAIEEFNQMRSEQRVISQKIGEIDFDLNEHR